MLTTVNTNVHNGKLQLRTLFVFGIILLTMLSVTWWLTRNFYDTSKATDRAFLGLDSSLNTASKFLMSACLEDSIYVTSKSRQPGYEKILILYKPKIDSVMLLARRMHDYIQTLKLVLNPIKDSNHDGKLTNKYLLKTNEKWNEETIGHFYDSLNSYSKLLSNILPSKMQQYNIITPIDTSNPISKNVKIWTKTHFDRLSTSAAMSSITELDYQIWLSANKMTNIIRSQWCDLFFEDFDIYKPLVSQNSMYFLPGQSLEISVGLGKYSSDVKPSITINGEKQKLNSFGIAEYKKVITNETNGSIPISINFINPSTGEPMTISQINGYSVLKSSKN